MKNKLYKIFALLIMLTLSAKIYAQCDNFVFAAANITKATCSATNPTGKITATITAGTPDKWELLDATTLAVLQTVSSNAMSVTFNNVAAGNYKVKVSSSTCNLQLTQDQVVGYYPSLSSSTAVIGSFYSNAFSGACGAETDRIAVFYGDTAQSNAIVYPITVDVTVHMPDGTTQVVTQTYNSMPAPSGNTQTLDTSHQYMYVYLNIPLVKNSTYTYDVKVTDGCNYSKTFNNRPLDTKTTATAAAFPATTTCATSFPIRIAGYNYALTGNVKATIISYNGSTTTNPAGTVLNLVNNYPSGAALQSCCTQNTDSFGWFEGFTTPLPVGTYVIKVSDDCGNTFTINYNHNPTLTYRLDIGNYPGCGLGANDVVSLNWIEYIQGDPTGSYKYVNFTNAQITAAPASAGMTLPYDVSNYISTSYPVTLTISGTVFPVPGTYTIQTTNACGITQSKTVTVGQYLPTYDATVVTGCNTFSVQMNFSNIKQAMYNDRVGILTNGHQFLLQYYNSSTGKWEHPLTGATNPTTPNWVVDSQNGIVLSNNTLNGPWAKSGKYRIVDVYVVDNRVYPYLNCAVTAKEFTVNFNISFNYNVIQCADGSFTLLASASGGNGNFTFNLYNSTHTNIVASNTTGVFTNIANGSYQLDITDTCPNSLLNQPINIPGTASPLAVKVTGDPCTIGSNVILSVPKLGGLSYKWFKTSAPGTTLSTSNEYVFAANPPTTSTSYSVQITYAADPTNCVNQTLTYVVPTCVCYRDANNIDPGIDTKHGVTLLKRAGSTDPDNWPMLRKSGHTVLESNTKGFVVTRMTSDPSQTTAANYIGKIAAPVEGMMVYDTFSKCLKIYVDGAWKCFVNPACPD